MILCNGVFEGGGVRGIGHVGAACRLEEAGYRFADLAGSSAGAIVAALLAAGYSCSELTGEMSSLDYMKFRGKGIADRFGAVGKAVSILFTLGIYHTGYLEKWLQELLEKKGMSRFGDLKKTGRTLKVTASDLTARKLLIFPDCLPEFGLEADSFPIARAVRMSVSIPVYFEPVRLREQSGKVHLIVDGGLLSNYPVWLFDGSEKRDGRHTLGFRFADQKEGTCGGACAEDNFAEYLKAIAATCLSAADKSHIPDSDLERTIRIPTGIRTEQGIRTISAVDFGIGREESLKLFENGRAAAGLFLKRKDGKSA